MLIMDFRGSTKDIVYHTISLKYNEFSLYVFFKKNLSYLPLKHGHLMKYFADCHIFSKWWMSNFGRNQFSMKMLPEATQIEDLIFFFFFFLFLHQPVFWGVHFSGFGPLFSTSCTPPLLYSDDDKLS